MIVSSLTVVVASSLGQMMLANMRQQVSNESREMAANQIQLVVNRMKLYEPAVPLGKCSYTVVSEDLKTGIMEVSATCSAGSTKLSKTITREVPLPVDTDLEAVITTEMAGLTIGEKVQ